MSAINIPAERVALVTKTINKLINEFHVPIDSDAAKDNFLSMFGTDIRWIDHAFCIRREGHEAVLGLQKGWTWCNQPFRTELRTCDLTTSGASIEIVWHGKQANDLIRPNGEVAVKASGRDYICHVNLTLTINEEGKITCINEFYNKHWDRGRAEAEYHVIKGPSMKG